MGSGAVMGCGASAGAETTTGTVSSGSKVTATVPPDAQEQAGYVNDNPGKKIQDVYELGTEKLGRGSYGSFVKCKHRTSKDDRVVRMVGKARLKRVEQFKQEIAILKQMDHPNVIKFYESFEDHRNFYLVIELLTGQGLFDCIIESGMFSETQAAAIMQQMLRAIYYLHENHICHRDLKPENFLFATKQDISTACLKLIGFGHATRFQENKTMTTKGGSPYYVAPQILLGEYTQAADLWSLGVIMYIIVCGYPPFHAESDEEILAKVALGAFEFRTSDWEAVSGDCKSLIKELLRMNPRERYTAEQALNHVWIRHRAPKAISGSNLSEGMIDNLRGFHNTEKLKEAAMQAIVNQLGEKQIKALWDYSMSVASKGDGSRLTAAEIKEGLKNAGLKEIPMYLLDLLEAVDKNDKAMVNYSSLLAASLDKKIVFADNACWQAFSTFDKTGNGRIPKAELSNILCQSSIGNVTSREISDLLSQYESNVNGDTSISFEDFMHILRADKPAPE
jgi:calcium-dependent protein kinase